MQSAKNYSYKLYNNANISYFTDSFVDKTGIINLIRASLKIKAIEKEITVGEIIEQLVEKYL